MSRILSKWKVAAAVLLVMAAAIFFAADHGGYLIVSNGDTGQEYARYPIASDGEFSVGFIHSVNKSPVTDVYQIKDGQIYVEKTIYFGFGAGVQTEVEPGQTLTYGDDGSMIVSGFDSKIDPLLYFVGTVSDHTLTVGEETISLRDLCGRNSLVRFSYAKKYF